MNNQKLIDRKSKKLLNPEDLWQDDWVLSRSIDKSVNKLNRN